jgi:hypothetical protein
MSKCFFCDKPALVEMKIIETGVFVRLCLDHLSNYVERKKEDEEQ